MERARLMRTDQRRRHRSVRRDLVLQPRVASAERAPDSEISARRTRVNLDEAPFARVGNRLTFGSL